MLKNKIIFATTSILSPIQKFQTESIVKNFPNSEIIIVDGRYGWFKIWYKWIDECLKKDGNWFIHIDEDCFIKDSKEILNLIEFMENNNYDIAGCPDGYHEYRSGNYMAYNSFFMVLNRKCLETWKKWINEKDYFPQFKKEWLEEYPYEKRGESNIVYYQNWDIWVPNTEPYYNFFWVLKECGIKFFYLEPKYDPELSTTNLLNDTVIHAWYLRLWNVDYKVSEIHKYPNKLRFEKIIEKVFNINVKL